MFFSEISENPDEIWKHLARRVHSIAEKVKDISKYRSRFAM